MEYGLKSHGLGDTLLLTSVLKYRPYSFTVQLLKENERFKILFDNLANVEICESEEEINPFPQIDFGHYSTRMLRFLYGDLADGMNNRPYVSHCKIESEKWAYDFLIDKKNPIVFVPNCSKQWSHIRSIPSESVSDIIKTLKDSEYTPIVCQSSKNKIETSEIELLDLDLSKYISLLRRVGSYVGANTGDEHLATAVGCKTHVYQPSNTLDFYGPEWNYKHPCSNYFIWQYE